jgi:hypothetical protein
MAVITYDTKKVHLYDGANLIDKTITPVSGAWSKAGVGLIAGSHDVKVQGEDKAGNISGFRTLHVITGSTVKPVVDLLDDTGESTTDNYTNDNTPRLKVSVSLPVPTGAASASPNSVDKIALWKYDAVALAYKEYMVTAAAFNAVAATFTPTTALADGDHKFKAKWLDKFGNWSALGTELIITIDTQSPTAPTIDNLVEGQVIVGTSVTISGGVPASV